MLNGWEFIVDAGGRDRPASESVRSPSSLDLIELVYEAGPDPTRWLTFVQVLERALGGALVVLTLDFFGSECAAEIISPSLDEDHREAYAHYSLVDPYALHMQHMPVGSFELVHAPLPENPEKGAFFREWMKPQGLRDGPALLGVIERSWSQGSATIVAFQRGPTEWGRTQLRLGRRLMCPLRRAVRIGAENARLRVDRSCLMAALDALPIAVIVVDDRLRLRGRNHAADRLLARGQGLFLARDQLRAVRSEESAVLARLVADSANVGSLGASQRSVGMRITRSPGCPPLEALVMPISSKQEEPNPAPPTAIVFVRDPEADAHPPVGILHDLYDFTAAESALAVQIASGRSLIEAARRLGIAHETARSRLKQIFSKTGTARQSALVRLLLIGPAQLLAREE